MSNLNSVFDVPRGYRVAQYDFMYMPGQIN